MGITQQGNIYLKSKSSCPVNGNNPARQYFPQEQQLSSERNNPARQYLPQEQQLSSQWEQNIPPRNCPKGNSCLKDQELSQEQHAPKDQELSQEWDMLHEQKLPLCKNYS